MERPFRSPIEIPELVNLVNPPTTTIIKSKKNDISSHK